MNQTVGAYKKNAWTAAEDYTMIRLDKLKDRAKQCRAHMETTWSTRGNGQTRGTELGTAQISCYLLHQYSKLH